MANKPQLKAVGEQDFSESDPFAELTRIMGFDPRTQATPRPEDDFQIDLEKELMGEFGADEEREDAPLQAGPAGMGRDVSGADRSQITRPEAIGPEFAGPQVAGPQVAVPAVSQPLTDDLEDALTSAFEQELGGESEAPDFSGGPGGEPAFVPQGEDAAASADELSSAGDDSDPEGLDEIHSASSISGETENVADRGPELAQSLNRLLSDAGYKSGSSFSGTAQVYEISTSYVTAPPAGDDAAHSSPEEAEPGRQESLAPEEFQAAAPSADHRSTVFGTRAPEWAVAPSAPFISENPSEETEAGVGFGPEETASTEAETSFGNEGAEEPEDPFAVLAALGSEPSPEASGQPVAPAATPGPAASRPAVDPRRFEGAARFYSSLDLFSRATPVAPGMRQPPRVSPPAALPEAEPAETSPEAPIEPASFVEEETIAAASVGTQIEAPEDKPEFADDTMEGHGGIAADAPVEEMQGEAAASADAEPDRPEAAGQQAAWATPQANAVHSDGVRASSAPASTPEIETIDIPEPAVAITDDLDIPALPVEETPPLAFDDLDHEFVAAFSDLRHKEQAVAAQPVPSNGPTPSNGPIPSNGDEELAAKIEELFAEEFDFSEHEPAAPRAAAMPAMAQVAGSAAAQSRLAAGNAYAPETYAFDEDYEGAAASSAYADLPEEAVAYPSSRLLAVRDRRGPLVAAIIGCVVIAGAVGAYAYSHYSTKESGPVLLKADAHPVKMKPKHPGGTKVPNQNSQVYKRVADGDVAAPVQQQKLVVSAEKPVDISAQAKSNTSAGATASSLPGVEMPNIPKASSQEIAALAKADANEPQKNQDRVPASRVVGTDTSRADDVIMVEPRKVRTMIVKPDGTMVPTPMPAATPAATPKSVAAAALEEPAQSGATAGKSALKPADQAGGGKSGVVTPQHVEVLPSRPAEQPSAVTEPASSEKVASLGDTHKAAPAAGWAMQIASQPSAQAAQESYQNLARRYGNVLGGHGVDIVKADIAGKGTYYRVRVPTASREEAINLCTKYKAAGGNCFVSR